MDQIGYSLIDGKNAEVQFWGDTPGQCVSMPSMIRLPNGDDVHSPSLGKIQDWRLVPRMGQFGMADSIDFVEGNIVVTRGLTQYDYQKAVESLINSTAQSRQYDSGLSLAGYVASTVPAWAAEALAFIAWRDAVWVYVYQALADVEQNKRAQPLVPDLIAELPAMVWPA